MPEFGIISLSLDWFKSYLDDRRQIVRINNFTGNEMVVNCGVPQGSVLGPILFILYINSICNLKIEGLITTYADDTCLLFSGNSWVDVRIKATKGCKRVVDFLNHRKLSINYDKTMFMNFMINDREDNFDTLKIHVCDNNNPCKDIKCKTLLRVSSIRYLGLIFDKNLRWNLHVNNLLMRLRTISYNFYKLRMVVPIHVVRTVYLALYQALLQYGLLIWGGLSADALKPLLIQQRQIVKICLKKPTLEGSTSQNFKLLNVLPVDLLLKKKFYG